MVEKVTVLVVGCGNMGAALAGAYARVYPEADVIALDRDPQRARALLPADSRVVVHGDFASLAGAKPSVVIIALKPQVLGDVLADFVALCADALVVSIAAGVGCGRLAALLGGHRRVVRAMPNLPVVAGEGMTTLFGDALSAADRAAAEMVFAAVGQTAWVADEVAIDRATAVAGSGPAYFFAFVDHLAAAGVAAGLPADLAERLARQTCIGAAALLRDDPRSAAALKAAVCSPGGTTQAGLAAMETPDGLAAIARLGVDAAYRRARELAGD